MLGHFTASTHAQVEQGEMLRLPRVEMCKRCPSPATPFLLTASEIWPELHMDYLSWLNSSQQLSPTHSDPPGGTGERIKRVKASKWAG